MAVYFCKCGRQVNKSTNADNTGNRDTAQCTGCPYLLPWGPDKYVEGQGFHKDVQGYECRMSPTLCYTTTYRGQASDKCTLHILSLDLDFLDTVQAWIDDHAADTLSAGFSRGSMRGTDFSDKGRYSLSISCAQNKKGMAAKAALIEQFFTGGRVRKDMTPAQEKARILAAIRRGKENASNMKYTISEHQNGLMYAYYKERFWFWHKDQNKWVPSVFATQQYDKAKAKDSGITPEMLLDNGSFNVLEEYQVPLQRRTALEALTPADSQVPAPDDREITKAPPAAAPASAEPPEIVDECSEPDEECPYLQPLENSKKYSCQCALCGDKFVNREICNKSFRGCGWYQDQQEKDARQDDEEEIPTTDFCQCRTCEHESCFAHGCTKECPANAEESCLTTSCPEYSKETTPCNTEPAPNGDAAATTAASAAPQPSQAAGTSTGSPGNSADASSCPSAEPVRQAPAALPLSAPDTAPTSLPAFDYSGLDNQTVADLHLAEREFAGGKRMAEIGLRRMADGVAIAHDALCVTIATNCRNGDGTFSAPEKTFGLWCDSVGLNRKAAERLLQVSKLFDNSTPREQKVLEELGPSLLYAAAKPSAPAELVQAVKDGDITTHKQYQDLLARYNAEHDAREQAEQQRDEAVTHIQAARDMQIDTARERDDALRRAAEAENRAAGAQKLASQRGDENTALKAQIRDLESRPVEVAVAQPGEEQIEAWRREGADRMVATMQETVRKANQEKLNAQNQVADLQQQLASARPDADACQRTADTLYETTENLRLLLRTQLRQAQLAPADYGNVVAHVLQAADALRDTVRSCAPAGYTMDDEEDDFL